MLIPQEPVDWPSVNEAYKASDKSFELFPIADYKTTGAIGLNIPFSHLTRASWKSAADFITALSNIQPVDTVDLYSGQIIDVSTFTPNGMQE